ncbi:MAG: hypothetical protein ACQES9_05565 [Myxococcota bacterium]
MSTASTSPVANICIKDRMLLRRVEKLLFASEVKIRSKNSAPTLEELKKNPDLLVISQDFLDAFLKIPKSYALFEVIILYNKNIEDIISKASKDRRLNHLIGIRDDGYPDARELVQTVKRMVYSYEIKGLTPYLDWYSRIHKVYVPSSVEMNKIVNWIPTFCESFGVPSKVGNSFAELGHELLMNAIYDAPVDKSGRHINAHSRKDEVKLEKSQYPAFAMGTNGEILGISVRDPFGGLKRKHIFSGLDRALSNRGELDTAGGGAGLGMFYIYNHGISCWFNVAKNNFTEVSVLYDITMNRRQFRQTPKSIHYFHN